MPEPYRANTSMAAGTVTLVFTDIEGSTRLWEQDGARMSRALAAHDALARNAVESRHGTVVKMTGDGMHAVFDDALDALTATVDLQQALADPAATNDVLLRVRCGLHTGFVERRDNDYYGGPVNRAARIMSAAHGGQVLLSQVVVDKIGEIPAAISLLDLGNVRLKDLSTPEHVYQVVHPQLQREFPALRSLEATPNNLPQQATSFIGREKELAQLKRLLARARLLTLTGSGGCGKTRLALQVAAEVVEMYPDGVWLVELAALSDPGLVPQTVAAVVGVREELGKALMPTLAEHLRSRQLLLVLDNAEHLVAACAELATAVLRQCPELTLLVTSRESLVIAGEQMYRVPSLSLPEPLHDFTPESIVSSEAVRLFVERAQAHRPEFRVTEQNAASVASICRRLDGIPLALELAAARVRALAVEEIDRGLDRRFRFLTGGSRTALPRHQTLRALIDWSYDLLKVAEQALLCRLAVFAGGWTLAAAEQVCVGAGVDNEEALDLMTALVDRSLVMADEHEGAIRYGLLETVRQYAWDRMRERGEQAQWQQRHLAYFLSLAEEAEPRLTGGDQQAWLDRVETEHDNLRAALAWSAAAGADASSGLRLAGALSPFWSVRGHLGEGRNWLSAFLGTALGEKDAAARAKALHWAATLAEQQGNYSSARALDEESLAVKRALGDRGGSAESLNKLGVVAADQGDYRAARTFYEESLAIRRELDDRRGIAETLNGLANLACDQRDYSAAWTLHQQGLSINRELGDRRSIAISLNNLGAIAEAQGDRPAARALYEECLPIFRELGDRPGIAYTLINLGVVVVFQGDGSAARVLYQESLAILRDLGDRRGTAFCLEGLADVALDLGRSGRAARIWGAAERLREEIGSPLTPNEKPRYEGQLAAACLGMGNDAAFDAAWKDGRAMTLAQAVDYALQGKDR